MPTLPASALRTRASVCADMASTTVVVGVDGSAGAVEALRQAALEARLREGRLRVVAVWHVPWTVYSAGAPGLDLDTVTEDLKAEAERKLEEALEQVAGDLEGIEIVRQVCEGQAAETLVEQSAGAALLVVGSRGLGGFGGLLLGSVSQQCAHHARCPVMIVHHPHAN